MIMTIENALINQKVSYKEIEKQFDDKINALNCEYSRAQILKLANEKLYNSMLQEFITTQKIRLDYV